MSYIMFPFYLVLNHLDQDKKIRFSIPLLTYQE